MTLERPERNSHDDLRLWLRLLFCASHIETTLQSRISGEFGMSLARFDLLAQLQRAEDGLTMTDLSRRMMVSNGATTNLVDRLVEDGLVHRAPHPIDRRTTIIRLTNAGRDRFMIIAREHEGWVQQLFEGVDDSVKRGLLDGLAALKQHLDSVNAGDVAHGQDG